MDRLEIQLKLYLNAANSHFHFHKWVSDQIGMNRADSLSPAAQKTTTKKKIPAMQFHLIPADQPLSNVSVIQQNAPNPSPEPFKSFLTYLSH